MRTDAWIPGVTIGDHVRTCQNRTFRATVGGEACRAASHRCPASHPEPDSGRVDLLLDLAERTPLSVRPRPFPSGAYLASLIADGAESVAVVFPFFDGVHAPTNGEADGMRQGALLRSLHVALESLERTYPLPGCEHRSMTHLVHGDFNATNVLLRGAQALIIDFENSHYASYEYDIANALYMAIFDHRQACDRFIDSGYLPGFISGYGQGDVEVAMIGQLIRQRVATLAGWLRDPTTGPRSIATAAEDWKQELRTFVHAFAHGAYGRVLAPLEGARPGGQDSP